MALSIGGFDENPDFNTVEDYDFWMRFGRAGRIQFIGDVLGEYVLAERAASRQILYHHANLENVLTRHLSAYSSGRPALDRLRGRRRMSEVYRSALRTLMQHDESPAKQTEYLLRMLRAFPFEPRNIAVALVWMARKLKTPAAA
jgi:hypothetical protein